MTLIILIKNPTGLVLAAESAETAVLIDRYGKEHCAVSTRTTKILSFDKPHNFAAAVTCGRAGIDGKPVNGYLKEFEMKLPCERLSVKEFADELSRFFMEKWDQSADKSTYNPELAAEHMHFFVAGFDKNEPYGRIYHINIPDARNPQEKSPGEVLQFASRARECVMLRGDSTRKN
jgi:hypothetical protein